MDDHEPRHRGEPEFEIFEPGDRIRARIGPRNKLGDYVFLVLFNGYCVEGDWTFHTSGPMTSEHFTKIGRR